MTNADLIAMQKIENFAYARAYGDIKRVIMNNKDLATISNIIDEKLLAALEKAQDTDSIDVNK